MNTTAVLKKWQNTLYIPAVFPLRGLVWKETIELKYLRGVCNEGKQNVKKSIRFNGKSQKAWKL